MHCITIILEYHFRSIMEQQLQPSGSKQGDGRTYVTSTPKAPKKSSLDSKPKKKQKTSNSAETELSGSLNDFIIEHKKNSDDFRKQLQRPPVQKTVEECFFDTCVLRMQKLPEATRSLLQLQISQIFFNAENPNLTPVSLTNQQPQQFYQSNQMHQYSNNAIQYQPVPSPTFHQNNQSDNHAQYEELPGPSSQCQNTNIIAQAMNIANNMHA